MKKSPMIRALLVDDEEEMVSTLAERLGFRNIEARWATTGEEALRLVASEPFDVAVLDMKMPGLEGTALRRRIQTLRPDMKFIFLTGYGSEPELEGVSSEIGAANCLVKPIGIDDLIARINALLQETGGPS